MPHHLISDTHEWMNEIPTVPTYYDRGEGGVYKLKQRKLNLEIHRNREVNPRVDCLKNKQTNYRL